NCKTQNKEGEVYGTDDASRSGLLLKGQSDSFRFQIFQGKDYRITICNEEMLGNTINFQIRDFDSDALLYDNKDYNYEKVFEFTCLTSRTVKIVVMIPSDNNTITTSSIGINPKPTQMGCVGVLIESMVTPKKGF
ncbi:MAG: hypothetical protein SNJ71_06530, partial [Bacteroidales bacterium]